MPECGTCGYAVDWGRSCYRSSWQLFKDHPELVTRGRFYFSPPGTPFYPGFHNFYSRFWTTEDGQTYDGLGEVPTGPTAYSNGVLGIVPPPAGQLGDDGCISGGERFPLPAIARTLPMGVDSRCYSERGLAVPSAPMGGLLLWHRPEGLAGGVEGSPVLAWRDDSGNGNHLSVLPPQPGPSLTLAFLGGLNAVVFQSVGAARQALSWNVAPTPKQGAVPLSVMYTVYMVATLGGPLGYKTGGSVDGVGLIARPVLGAGFAQVGTFTLNGAVLAATTFLPLESHIWHVRRLSTFAQVGVDGVALNTATVPAGEAVSAARLATEALAGPSSRSTVISEVLVYPFTVDDENHRANIAYLASRYGIILP